MITLVLSADEIQLIGRALGQLPYAIVAELINKINDQISNCDSGDNGDGGATHHQIRGSEIGQ